VKNIFIKAKVKINIIVINHKLINIMIIIYYHLIKITKSV